MIAANAGLGATIKLLGSNRLLSVACPSLVRRLFSSSQSLWRFRCAVQRWSKLRDGTFRLSLLAPPSSRPSRPLPRVTDLIHAASTVSGSIARYSEGSLYYPSIL